MNHKIKEVFCMNKTEKNTAREQTQPKTHKKNPMKNFKKGTIKRLLSYMSEYRVHLVVVGIGIIVSAEPKRPPPCLSKA